ncbi:MAG: hypothetical protein ACFE9I_08940 [Candidatus Hermodarchaeota archaeon]
MNKSRLFSKLTLSATVGILIFSFISTVNAGIPPFLGPIFGDQWIGNGAFVQERTIDGSKESYYRIGWGLAIPLELDEGWNTRPPFKETLTIDGKEVKLRRCHILFKDIEDIHPETGEPITYNFHLWIWYQFFEPNFFEKGEHIVKCELLIKKLYGEDPREKGWRIFINYDGPEFWYGPQWPDPGSVYSYEHTLIVE